MNGVWMTYASLAWLVLQARSSFGAVSVISPQGGCKHPAVISVAVGSGSDPSTATKVLDLNIRTKWVAFGKGKSLWLELATPTFIDSVAIAFRKGHKRVHKFRIFLITPENQAKLAFAGRSSGDSRHLQTFDLGNEAQEAVAVTIVGRGNTVNAWNGYSEVQLCARESMEQEETGVGVTTAPLEQVMPGVELPFPDGRKGFNVVNMCTFPIRVGATGSEATCGTGTMENPDNGKCYWAFPDGNRDLAPGEASQYVLPELGLKDGSIRWAGNVWASTGCTSDISSDYDHPSVDSCVTNYCPSDGTCTDYAGAAGATTKAEFAMQEGGLDFYDVSVIDGANIPLAIEPIDPVFSVNEHYCGAPGSTEAYGGAFMATATASGPCQKSCPEGFPFCSSKLEACSWKFNPENIGEFAGENLSPYTKLVWPSDPDDPVTCTVDSDCKSTGTVDVCGVYEEREDAGALRTNALVPHVCGVSVGWMNAHHACGATTKGDQSFPEDYPFHCDRAARHGTFKQDSCCGCPPWDEDNGGCVSTNPDWLKTAYPWAKFFKDACPTAYSFSRDDRTSTFVCSNGGLDSTGDGANTQSYTIRFCPGDSEINFYQ